MITILSQCRRELDKFPLAVREDLADALARLKEGHILSLPLSRPMPNIAKSVHELRLKDRSGVYRIIYFIKKQSVIYLVHAFKKTSQKTERLNIITAQRRLRELNL